MAHVRARDWVRDALRDYRACDGNPGIHAPRMSAIQAHAIEVIGSGVAWLERQRIKQMEDDAKARARG